MRNPPCRRRYAWHRELPGCPAVALTCGAQRLCSAHLAMFGTGPKAALSSRRCTGGSRAWDGRPAGSDAAGTRTVAVRDGEGWVVNGSKTFITHGKVGGVMVVMAVTDRAKGNRGISAFVVPHGTPGMQAGRKENKLGMRASDTSEVIFTDCRVPLDALVCEEGRGSSTPCRGSTRPHRHRRARRRPGPGSVRRRRQLCQGAPSVRPADRQLQATQFKIADLPPASTPPACSRLRAAHMKDRGLRTPASRPRQAVRQRMAVKAADGACRSRRLTFVKDYPAEKYFRDVKLLTIGEGTSEIQRMVIARQLLA